MGRPPLAGEVADALEIDEKELEAITRATRRTVSLNASVGQQENTELIQLIEDYEVLPPDENLDREALCSEVNELLDHHLTPRERDILSLRFGLSDGQRHTLDQVGHIFGLTRQRIRQIQAIAFRKLRRTHSRQRLDEWLNPERTNVPG